MDYKGSTWRKWDLHVHTPISYEQAYGGDTLEVWNKYVDAIENLKTPYSVMGVNDYFTIEGYKRLLEYKAQGRLKNIELFPVIELRVRTFGSITGKDPWKRVNMHVIFDNKEIDKIETEFINILKFEYHSFHKTGLNKENLILFGQHIIDGIPEEKRDKTSPLKVGFNNLNFAYRDICEKLEKSGLNYIIALGKAEWDALRWESSIAEKKDVIKRSDMLFTAAKDAASYNKSKEKLKSEGISITLLDCSDSHCFPDKMDKKDNLIKDRLGNCLTWIKADKTFEGLKQVLYEPKYRLHIGNLHPIHPPRRIEKVSISLPESTLIGRKGDSEDNATVFCLAGNNDLFFSPNFTCIIGGRGAGKSTILNLIAEKAAIPNGFFDKNILYDINESSERVQIKEIENCIEIIGTSQIEYISQNEIEAFAENKDELTNAIYERIKQNPFHKSDRSFEECEMKIATNISRINNQIRDVHHKYEKENLLKELNLSLANDELIVNSSKNPEYIEIRDEIQSIGKKVERIKNSKVKYQNLTSEINNLISKYKTELENPNIVEAEIKRIITVLQQLLVKTLDETTIDKEYSLLLSSHKKKTTDLEVYLQSQGLNQENIADYERAVSSIPENKSKISIIKKELLAINNDIQSFTTHKDSFLSDKHVYEALLKENIIPLNENLKSKNKNVKDIAFKYQFDFKLLTKVVFNEFWDYFEHRRPSYYHLNSQVDAVQRYLFQEDLKETLDLSKDEFLTNYTSQNPTQAEQYLKKLFAEDGNFEIYQLIILRNLINPNGFKWITGYYDDKELRNCSFGQRCTAVIVALLSFGNKPLIIDEPEAHLDSKLIAEYLVDLVKDRKSERQIIFATHNANFVVNGDAELILHLEINDKNITEITPISIENIEHREKLLLLEGGEEAFKKRDNRLIKNR